MNNTITLTKILNPLSRTEKDVFQFVYSPDQSLASIKSKYLPEDVSFIISLNGVIVAEDRLPEIYLRPDDYVVCVPQVLGGDDGKMIGRLIGTIVIAIAAAYTGPAAAGAYAAAYGGTGAVAGAMASAAVMMVGGMLLNAVLPPPKPKLPSLGDDYGNSQAFSWNPQTLQQQGVSIPRWYGRNKLYGNVVGAYVQTDTTRDGDKQILNTLISLGVGPFNDIDPTLIKINDQLINNFDDVVPVIRLGELNQTTVSNFNDVIIERTVNQKITKELGTVTFIPDGNQYDALEIELIFPAGLFQIDKTTGSYIRNFVELSVELIGPNGSEFLTQTYSNVVSVSKIGWSLGKYVSISNTDSDETLDGFETSSSIWVERLVGETEYGYSDETGSGVFHINGETDPLYPGYKWKWFGGNIYGTQSVNVLITSYNSPITNRQRIFSHNDKSVRRLTIREKNLAQGSHTIKVTRYNDDNTSDYVSDDFYLNIVREITSEKFSYPRNVLVSLEALATDQLSGSLRFSCIGECLLVRVYNGTTWSIVYNNNPAWVLYDLLTQPVYSGTVKAGLTVVRYDGIDPSRLDLPKFKEWADWCDVLCPDGKGGTEKRITFNGGFDSETSLWDGAMQVCQVGGAALIWNGIKLSLAIDKPSDPVQMFSVGNTSEDSFSGSFLSMEDRAAEIEADFVNIEKDYSRDKYTITNNNIATIASKVNLPMFGVSKPSEVWRLCKRRLAYNELISRSGSFSVDIDALACTVGDVVLLQSDIPQWGFGGRVVSATTNSVTLDKDVTLEVDKTYSIMVRLLNDTIVERTVTNVAGTYSVLNVLTDFTTLPVQYDIYAVGETDQSIKPVRITNIQKANDLQMNLTWIEYNESIYDVDQDLPTIPTVNYSSLPLNVEITNLQVIERLQVDISGNLIRDLILSWNVVDASIVKNFEIFYKTPTSGWQLSQIVNKNSAVLSNIEGAVTYHLAVKAVSIAGLSLPFSSLPVVKVTTTSDTEPKSPPVDSFLIAELPDKTRALTWSILKSSGYTAGYKIKYGFGSGVLWANMFPLHSDLLTSSPFETTQLAAGTYTVAIVSVDLWGNESEPKYIEIELEDPQFQNLLLFEKADILMWPGTLTNCHMENGVLAADGQALWSELPSTWATWLSWSFDAYGSISYEHTVVDVGLVTVVTPYIFCEAVGTVALQMQYSVDNVTWSSWVDISKVNARYFKIKATVTSELAYIVKLDIYMDTTPMVEEIEDLDTSTLTGNYRIGVGDIRLPLTKSFNSVKQVRIALQNVGAGWTWELIDKNILYGPRIKIYNGSGVLADAIIDADIKGL